MRQTTVECNWGLWDATGRRLYSPCGFVIEISVPRSFESIHYISAEAMNSLLEHISATFLLARRRLLEHLTNRWSRSLTSNPPLAKSSSKQLHRIFYLSIRPSIPFHLISGLSFDTKFLVWEESGSLLHCGRNALVNRLF